MLTFKLFIWWVCCFSKGSYAAPATTSSTISYGSLLADGLDKNFGALVNNIRSGVVSLATPPIKFGVDTIPSLISQGIHTAADKVIRLGEANAEAVGNVAVGVSDSVSGGAVLGSSVAKGAMQMLGGALGAGNDIAHAVGQAGVRLAGHVADSTATGAVVAGNVTGTTLSAIGDGLEAAASGVTLLSSGLSSAIDTISENIIHKIYNVEQSISNLINSNGNTTLTQIIPSSVQTTGSFVSVLNAVFLILVKVQSIFNSLTGLLF